MNCNFVLHGFSPRLLNRVEMMESRSVFWDFENKPKPSKINLFKVSQKFGRASLKDTPFPHYHFY
jgi:hypothetical protein